jgi:hypothetical protein
MTFFPHAFRPAQTEPWRAVLRRIAGGSSHVGDFILPPATVS